MDECSERLLKLYLVRQPACFYEAQQTSLIRLQTAHRFSSLKKMVVFVNTDELRCWRGGDQVWINYCPSYK